MLERERCPVQRLLGAGTDGITTGIGPLAHPAMPKPPPGSGGVPCFPVSHWELALTPWLPALMRGRILGVLLGGCVGWGAHFCPQIPSRVAAG